MSGCFRTNKTIVRRIDKCISNEPNKCNDCWYKDKGYPQCVSTLLSVARDDLEWSDTYISELESELRQARWGTNYNK